MARALAGLGCGRFAGEEIRVKTKTQHIIGKIEASNYTREPQKQIIDLPKLIARTIIMAQYGMLECANNYANKYGSKMCRECQAVDDEDHRINYCVKYRAVNGYDHGSAEKNCLQ